MQYYFIKLYHKDNNRKYLELRNYKKFLMINTIVIKTEDVEEIQELESFLYRHNIPFLVQDSFINPKPQALSYELQMNFMVQDKNMNRFKKYVEKTLLKFWENDNFTKISLKEMDNFNGCITSMKFRIVTKELIDDAKIYLDIHFKHQFYSKLKMYNEGRNVGIAKIKKQN